MVRDLWPNDCRGICLRNSSYRLAIGGHGGNYREWTNRYALHCGQCSGLAGESRTRMEWPGGHGRDGARTPQRAWNYDRYGTGTCGPNVQQSMEDDVDRIQAWLVTHGRMPSWRDCGGGTGNVALKMLERGWKVTVVDVSDEMLGLLKEKARTKG